MVNQAWQATERLTFSYSDSGGDWLAWCKEGCSDYLNREFRNLSSISWDCRANRTYKANKHVTAYPDRHILS